MEDMKRKIEEEIKESPADIEQKTIDIAAAQFFQLSRLLNVFKKEKGLSRKGCIRAIEFAINHNVSNKKIILRGQAEYQLATILHEMLGPRTIMQADILKRLDKETENGKEQE